MEREDAGSYFNEADYPPIDPRPFVSRMLLRGYGLCTVLNGEAPNGSPTRSKHYPLSHALSSALDLAPVSWKPAGWLVSF